MNKLLEILFNLKIEFAGLYRNSLFRTFACILPVVLFPSLTYAQTGKARVSAKADTNQIRIGEQFNLQLSSTIEKGQSVVFPFFPDTFNHFEVVKRSGIDTIVSQNTGEISFTQNVTLTSFDSGYFVLPPFDFQLKSAGRTDTLSTEAMLVNVTTVAVDTTKEIKTIKNIVGVPFPWQDFLLFFLIAIVLAAVSFFLWKRYNRFRLALPGVYVQPRPAYEIALEALKRIEEEKLWQQGFIKKFHSDVTDVLRTYIEHRFEIKAMEQTTDEILSQFQRTVIHDEERERLGFILRMADMVKFAKAQPLPPENERSLLLAFEFVNVTRPVTKQDVEKKEEEK